MTADYRCRFCDETNSEVVYGGIRDWEYGVTGSWDYVCCAACRGVQLSPFPDLMDLQRAYDIDYHGYTRGGDRGTLFSLLYAVKEWLFRRRMRKLVNHDSRVLDVGCGAGEFLLGLRGLGVTRLEGIDFSEDMVARLREENLQGFAGTFEDFPGSAATYHLISMNNYLEHTLTPDTELAKARELLVGGGYLVGEVPGFQSPDRKLFGRYWGGNHVPRHTFQFTPAFLRSRLSVAGFEDIEISHQVNPSHWALSMQNFLQRNVSDLRHNPALVHGRSRYYMLTVLAMIPFSAIAALLGQSSCIKFYARKPEAA